MKTNGGDKDRMRQINSKANRCLGSGETTNQLTKDFVFFTDNLDNVMKRTTSKAEDLILFTKNKKQITELGGETLNSIIMNCRCSSNVAVDGWWTCYHNSLSPYLQRKVTILPNGVKKFRFGGGACYLQPSG